MMDKWIEVKLSDIGKTYSGLSNKSAKDFGYGKDYIPYLNIYNNSKVNINFFEKVNIKKRENQNKVKYGDIFFTTSSETPDEVGMSSVLLDEVNEVYLNSFCFGFRLNDFNTLRPEFARYYFRGMGFRKQMNYLAQGSTRYNLSKVALLKYKAILPTIPEQSKIAEILTTIDDAIEQTEKIIEKYKRIKQGLLQDLLTKGIDENGNIRSEATHKFKDSPLGRIPVEWKVESISSILVNKEGAIKVGPFGSQLRKDELCENGYKVYGQENAFYKDFNIGKRYINKSKFKQLKSCELLSGDFIISMMGTIGRCAIVPNDIEKGIMDSHLIRLRIKNYNLKLLIYLIEDYHLTKQQIKNMSVGGIMEGLNSKVIKQILIPVPPSKEQEMIVSLLDCCLNVINYEESILNKLKSIKQGLMQDLLSGKVRVTHLLK